MPQTLTKPVLLDETGQDIVEKLDDIKEAISTGSEFTPVMIKVTTPPAKVAYMAGESLDLAGIVVDLIASNGVHIDVTDQCTFVPANGTTLTSADTSVAISYYWYKDDVTFTTSYPIGVKSLASIAITTPPTLTEYTVGDELDLTGIVVTATYDDGTFLDVTQNCTFSPADGATLTLNDTTVTVTYSEGTITKTATQSLTIIEPIYGVEWDGTASSAMTRTDAAADFSDPVPQMSNGSGGWTQASSPFDNILPWSGMEKVTDSSRGDSWVKIPKYYYSLDFSNGRMKLQISPLPKEGFSVSPAHRDTGNGEKDYVYVGAYLMTNIGCKSGQAISTANMSNYGSWGNGDRGQWGFDLYWTIIMLYLVEFADWNSQSKIGVGANGNHNTGTTDSMTYHTGTTATSPSSYGVIRYRFIEDLWGYYAQWLDGAKVTAANKNLFLWNHPTAIASLAGGTTGGENVGTIYKGEGFIKSFEKKIPSFGGIAPIPASVGTNGYTTDAYAAYVNDVYIYTISSGTAAFSVGGYGVNKSSGLFWMRLTVADTYDTQTSARAMFYGNFS